MALYAIGDFHLSFKVNKPMHIFDEVWRDHPDKIYRHWHETVKETDTVIIAGDHSWGNNLTNCAPDLDFIAKLPGRKILLRGNHDLFWDVKKTNRLNELYKGRLEFLQNNFYTYEDYALVGTKGICYEGKISYEQYLKLMDREMERLKKGFESAAEAGHKKFLMFLHYPPTSVGETESPFTQLAKEYQAEKVIYSHCHGTKHYDDSLKGVFDGIEYKLVSSDYLRFQPELILE